MTVFLVVVLIKFRSLAMFFVKFYREITFDVSSNLSCIVLKIISK